MIEVSVKGANAVCTNPLPLTTGMEGVKAKFIFSDDWQTLTPIAVFTNGRTTLDAVITDNIATIPHEVLAIKNRMVLVGICGTDTENHIVIPTVYAELGYVSLGADPTGDESATTSPALYQQAIEKADAALESAGDAEDDAATALEYATEVKRQAEDGELDGYSPTATVVKTSGVSTITITDKNGTTTAEVLDGSTPVKGTDYFTSAEIASIRAGLENQVNKTTVLSSASTNAQYPSAKAVRDYVLSMTQQFYYKLDAPDGEGTVGQVLKLGENGTVWADESGGGGGTSDYNQLTNKPSIGGVTLSGSKTVADIGAAAASHTHAYSAITGKPSTFTPSAHNHVVADISDFPSIPTDNIELANGAGYITDAPSDSKQYARKNGAWAEVVAGGGGGGGSEPELIATITGQSGDTGLSVTGMTGKHHLMAYIQNTRGSDIPAWLCFTANGQKQFIKNTALPNNKIMGIRVDTFGMRAYFSSSIVQGRAYYDTGAFASDITKGWFQDKQIFGDGITSFKFHTSGNDDLEGLYMEVYAW